LVPSTSQTLDEVAVRVAVVHALVECEKKTYGDSPFSMLTEVHYDDVPASDVRCFTK
jgi:hypothetical protein